MKSLKRKKRWAFLSCFDHLNISFSHIGLHRKCVLAQPGGIAEPIEISTEGL